jgi:hypothetical protein
MRLNPSTVSAHPSADSSRKRTRERAFELAAGDGRAACEAGKSDWEQAKFELSGPSGSGQLRMGCEIPAYPMS